jgi:hypothetical protein
MPDQKVIDVVTKGNVIYVMSGPAHLPYLVASLWSLRKSGHVGSVTVHAWPESIGIVRQIEKDKRLRIKSCERKPNLRRKDGYGGNAQFLDKIQVAMNQVGSEVTLYLDADTTIHGDLTPLMVAGMESGFCATQWNDWKTHRGHAHRRVKELLQVKEIPEVLVKEIISKQYPSVNGGVWAARHDSPVLSYWYEWTKACKSMFISDERVLHLMQVAFTDSRVMTGGIWNCSPKFQPSNVRDDDVIVRHYHGDSNVRPNKSLKGINLWYPIYKECLKEDVGGINGWIEEIKNKWMDRLGDYSLSVMCG